MRQVYDTYLAMVTGMQPQNKELEEVQKMGLLNIFLIEKRGKLCINCLTKRADIVVASLTIFLSYRKRRLLVVCVLVFKK